MAKSKTPLVVVALLFFALAAYMLFSAPDEATIESAEANAVAVVLAAARNLV